MNFSFLFKTVFLLLMFFSSFFGPTNLFGQLLIGHEKSMSPFFLHKDLFPFRHNLSIVEPKNYISDDKARLELARLLSKHKKSLNESLDLYIVLLDKHPHNIRLILETSWIYSKQKKYTAALSLLNKALMEHPNNVKLLVEAAHAEQGLNHPIQAQELLLKALSLARKKEPILMDYANTLMTVGSFYQVEAIYLDALRREPWSLELALKLAWVYVSSQRYEEAEGIYKKLLNEYPSHPRVLEALVSFRVIEKKFEEALAFNEILIQLFPQKLSYVKTKENILFRNHLDKNLDTDEQANSIEDLMKLANTYSENGMADKTAPFYRAALNRDPDYFPAQIGLAQALSSIYKYDEALDIYFSILDYFPENSKIMIEIARIYSWGKEYELSMEWYDAVIALNPQDPVPRREKARVAYWGKFFEESMRTYDELLYPPVDQLILNELANHKESETEEILDDFLPLYLTQKSIALERNAKCLDWNNNYLHALPVYGELAEFNPWNEEGLFGYAQDYCNIGQCQDARCLYNHLLNIDPNHNIVKMALERNWLRENPILKSNFAYWRELGIGQFSQSQIARYQFDETYEYSPSCNTHYRFIQHVWVENPFYNNKFYPAEGQTIEADKVFNGYIKGALSATCKNYFHKFVSRTTGLASLWFNLYDYANLGIGYERKNEIYNYFSLKEGIQSDVYWLSLATDSHLWGAAATYWHQDFNDSNNLDHANILLSYTLTEDPNCFRLILNGDYWNTAYLTIPILDPCGEIIYVVHPYWTPQEYYSGGITLAYRYNYAYFTYCEAPQRYIDMKLTFEQDSVNNPSVQLILEWKHELMVHWGFELKGYIHRSELWNAEGVWGQFYYRF